MLPYIHIVPPYGLNVPINFTRMRRIYTCLRVFVSVSVLHPLCPWFLLFLFLNTVPINSSSKGHVLGKVVPGFLQPCSFQHFKILLKYLECNISICPYFKIVCISVFLKVTGTQVNTYPLDEISEMWLLIPINS